MNAILKTDSIKLKSNGHSDIVDFTSEVNEVIKKSGLTSGVVCLFVVGSTAGLTTIEYEPGLVADMKEALERVAPLNARYRHHERWGDDNGHSHIRASFLGPSLTIPFAEGQLTVGTWQQIILIDFDTRSRVRHIMVHLIGSE
jgi:secondary thiamine-phosphate synthase enzyme